MLSVNETYPKRQQNSMRCEVTFKYGGSEEDVLWTCGEVRTEVRGGDMKSRENYGTPVVTGNL